LKSGRREKKKEKRKKKKERGNLLSFPLVALEIGLFDWLIWVS
jgi:hypothetical protein